MAGSTDFDSFVVSFCDKNGLDLCFVFAKLNERDIPNKLFIQKPDSQKYSDQITSFSRFSL